MKRQLSARSERVKCCDFHPQEPWVLSALYSGHIFIWNYNTQTMVKSIEVCDLPVRCAKFIPQKQWIICGTDDYDIHVYNYNTLERVKQFEAHTDYIRSIAVHPTLPYVLSSSDDALIKLWDWEKGWQNTQIFEGHDHYVMQVEFNPKDTNTFASASLDRTVKVWGLNSSEPHFSLEGHERGVNCIGYFRGGDRPYLISGADDHTAKIWDYQTKTCVATLEGHTNNVSAVTFHPHLPIIITGSEDGTVRLWHATTYRPESTLNYGMERVWSIACLKGHNKIALGYDEGTIMIKLGHEEPVVSMEKNGKIVWANNHDIVLTNVRTIDTSDVSDGDKLTYGTKDLGSCENYPQSLKHDPKGRLLCACGDGEYIIYTALSLKNKGFGTALEFVWSSESGVYATRESSSKIKVFKNFQESKQFRPSFAAEGIFGGQLLGVRTSEFIDFYDWAECRTVRRIEVCPRNVYWSDTGEVAVLACEGSFYVLRYNSEIVQKYFDQNIEIDDDGIDKSFDLELEINESVVKGCFVGDCFIYTTTAGRLNYLVGGEVMTLAHLTNKNMHLLGYLPKENRVYLMDRSHNIISYSLLMSVLAYQTAIVRKDFDAANQALQHIPEEHHSKIARFLEANGLKEMALQVSKNPEHRFELALEVKNLRVAQEIALEHESEQKWRQVGDLALSHKLDLTLTEQCYTQAKDLGGLLLLYSSTSDRQGMQKLAKMAVDLEKHNIAFVCYFLLNQIDECIDLLINTGRVPEAAFMTRTYAPSHISKVLKIWKEDLKQVSIRAADSLADPESFPDLFPDLPAGVAIEEYLTMQAKQFASMPSTAYPQVQNQLARELVQEYNDGSLQAEMQPPTPEPEPVIEAVEEEKEVQPEPTPEPTPSPSPAPAPVVEATPEPTATPTPAPEIETETETAPITQTAPEPVVEQVAEAEPEPVAEEEKEEEVEEEPVVVETPADIDVDAFVNDLDVDVAADADADAGGDSVAPSAAELDSELADLGDLGDWGQQ